MANGSIKYVLVLLIIQGCLLLSIWSWDYCTGGRGLKLCELHKIDHLQCDPEGNLPKKKGYVYTYPMTEYLKRLLLEMHNRMRNKVASGTEDNGKGDKFPVAARMREMLWDDELAYIGYLHSLQCNFAHSKCHVCPRFPFAGQNLGYMSISQTVTAFLTINASMEMFYVEKNEIADPVSLAKMHKKEYTPAAGHFITMMIDHSSFMGCAYTHCKNCIKSEGAPVRKRCYLLSCQYEQAAINTAQVYKIGTKPGDDCAHWGGGKSSKYPNLCENNRKIFPVVMPTRPPKTST